MENAVLTEKIFDALVIIFNRPAIRNPLSIFVLNRLEEILDETEKDSEISKIIFTGKSNVFASGADLRELTGVSGETARAFARRGQRLMNKISASEKLTIAAVNGFCFGGALDLALACKKRIAARTAQFCHPGVNLGIMTGWGGTQRLPELIGEANALEMFMTAKKVSAEEASKIGLIDATSEDLLNDALKMS